MNNINVLLDNLETTILQLGRVGENEHTQIRINCISIFSDYPNATVAMTVQPPQGEAYPKVITRSGVMVSWVVLDSDLVADGSGQIQLTFTNEDEIIKTVIGNTQIFPSLEPTGDVPTPIENWIDTANEIVAEFQSDITDIQRITTAEASDEGKVLSAKTVTDGKVTEWDYVDVADPDVITQAVDDWLDDHPEATTTVQDGAITEAKLNDSLKADLAWQDDVDGLMSAITQEKAPVILDTASGEIVTIPDGADGMKVETLTVAIEPKQDLHGQSNPYPAGGGKNLLNVTANSQTINGVTVTVESDGTIKCTNNATQTVTLFLDAGKVYPAGTYILNGCPSGGGNSTFKLDVPNASYATDTGSGVSFTTDGTTGYAVRLVIYSGYGNGLVFKPMIRLSSVSDSTFAPYSNICPISGWSAAEVVRTGKNLFGGEIVKAAYLFRGIGNYRIEYNDAYRGFYCRVKSGKTYTISRTAIESNRFRVMATKTEPLDNVKCIELSTNGDSSYSVTVAVPDGYNYLFVYLSNNSENCNANNYMVEIGDTATTPEAYDGDTYTYSFPSSAGTVYGGTLTVNADGTGTLVVDKELVTYDGSSDEGWSQNGEAGVFIYVSNNIGFVTNKYKVIAPGAGTSLQNGQANYNNARNAIQIRDDRALLVSDFKTLLESENLQILYNLATPITYNLTALEVVELLKGVNNLWADCGNVSIEYPCDTKLYVDKKIMEAIANALNA